MKVRPVRTEDAAELAALLNEIIEIGGTTAYEVPVSAAYFREGYIENDDQVSCVVAEGEGVLLGFQHLRQNGDTGDIATFARAAPKVPGVGRALFASTLAAARAAGLSAITARIRADNVPGLGYYTAMGFEDWSVDRAVPLRDGTPVDRITKRLPL